MLDRALSILSAGLAPRTKANLSPPDNRGWYRILEAATGNWQRNIEVDHESVLANSAVFACMTLIASDIAKLRVKLVRQTNDGIWEETTNAAYSPVLRKPNHFQTRMQFFESWVLSKLSRGNTYILKRRDNRNVVTALYVLDPNRTKPMIAPDGAIYYQLSTDNIAGIEEDQVLVPASEIIHDRYNCEYHPLVGLSPIIACGLAATQGLKLQENSASFFANLSKPGGLLIAPGRIDPDNAARLKETWETNYSGKNAGKIAVLGDGMTFTPLTVSPVDAQMVEQMKWTSEVVCSVFHVPNFMIGVGQEPSAGGVQDRTLRYYSQCLQKYIKAIQECLTDGLATPQNIGIHLDLDGLLLMDSRTQMEVLEKAKGTLTLDERRRKVNAKPIFGGDTVYLQEQDHSIAAIAARDKLLIEQAEAGPVETPAPPANDDDDPEAQEARAIIAGAELRKALMGMMK